MRAAFFFREGDGSARTESIYPEVQLLPREISGVWEQSRQEQQEAAVQPIADPKALPPLAAPLPRNLPLRRRRKARRSWAWRRGFVAAFLLVTLGVTAYSMRDRLAPLAGWWQGPPVDLRMEKEADGILVRWDPRAAPVQSATGGTLHVEDADSSSAIPLDSVQLRSGFAAFRTQSSSPRPRLILRQPDGRTVVEVLRPSSDGKPRDPL
jgi:hypothetical protein